LVKGLIAEPSLAGCEQRTDRGENDRQRVLVSAASYGWLTDP